MPSPFDSLGDISLLCMTRNYEPFWLNPKHYSIHQLIEFGQNFEETFKNNKVLGKFLQVTGEAAI